MSGAPVTAWRVLVTGSRTWDDRDLLETAVRVAWVEAGRPTAVALVHGGARGADTMADTLARHRGWTVEEHRADWARYGRRAGYLRNAEMVDLGADICLAFIRAGSPGATMCAALAEDAGIRTVRVEAP